MAVGHYENFPVASLLLPARLREPVEIIYRFARSADDFADEGDDPPQLRLRKLNDYRAQLAAPASPLFRDVEKIIREHDLPVQLFADLLDAFSQDVTQKRYGSYSQVLDYCRRSANPVGRLVLRIAGYDEPRLDAWSDDICSALQLTNFWQDLKIDFDRGRVYIPEDELRAHGASPSDLAGSTMTPAWTRSVAAAVSRTRALFDEGLPLCDAVRGRLKYELRATWLGGTRILDRLERSEYDMIHRRPSLGLADAPWFAWRMLSWSSSAS